MNKELIISEAEQYDNLLGEIKAINVNAKNVLQIESLRWKFQIGEAITRSALYQKNVKGSGKLMKRLEDDLGYRKSLLYSAVAAYRHYSEKLGLKEGTEIADTVWKEHRNWTGALRAAELLPVGDSRSVESSCPKHNQFHLLFECLVCRKSERVGWGELSDKSRQKISMLLNKKLI